MDCDNYPGRRTVISDFLPQLCDTLVQRSRGAVVLNSPDPIEQIVPGKSFTPFFTEKLEQLHLFGSESLSLPVEGHLIALRTDRCLSHFKGLRRLFLRFSTVIAVEEMSPR